MAVSQITCPECATTLKPAKPVAEGKKVKCPECGAVFTVRAEEPEAGAIAKKPAAKPAPARAAPKKAEEPPPPAAAPKPAGDDEDGGVYAFREPEKTEEEKERERERERQKEERARRKARRRARDDDDDEDEDDDDDEDEEDEEEGKPTINYAPDLSIKDKRGPAVELLAPPTSKLILSGVIGFIGWLLLLALILIPILFPITDEEGSKDNPKPVLQVDRGLGGVRDEKDPVAPKNAVKDDEKERPMFSLGGYDMGVLGLYAWYTILIFLSPFLILLIYSALCAFGAVQAQNLTSRGWGIASSIMTMLPFNIGGALLFCLFFLELILITFMDDVRMVEIAIISIVLLAEVALGIWGLITMLKPEVIEGFEYVPEEEQEASGRRRGREEDEDEDEDEEED
jgi:hypothetical protein